METLTPQRLLAGRYRLDAPLQTQDGVILWRATDILLDRGVRIRTLPPGGAADPFLDLARQASRCLAPSLVPVLDADKDGEIAFAVLAIPEGEPLDAALAIGPRSAKQAVRTCVAVLQALVALNGAGVPHRSPTAADIYGDGDEARVDVLADDDASTPREDTVAVAGLLYRCLTGRDAASPLVPPRSIDARIDRAIDDVVMLGLAEDLDTPEAFLAALDRIRFPDAPELPALEHRDGWFRGWMLVPAAIVVVTSLIIVGGRLVAETTDGRQVLSRATPTFTPISQPAPPTPTILSPQRIRAFDPPPGDGVEGTAEWAADDDRATVWQSEDYFGGTLNKPGVGLLVDLGSTTTVTGFRLRSPDPGWTFQMRVGEDPDALSTTRGPSFEAQGTMREPLRPKDGRYVVVWVTDVTALEDGSHRASISEVQFEGITESKRA